MLDSPLIRTRPEASGGRLKTAHRIVAGLFSLAMVFIFASAAFSQTITFETPTYTLGNINGQDGWTKTGPFDSVVSTSSTAGFGAQSLAYLKCGDKRKLWRPDIFEIGC